jgi:3-hydroxymyristoyl/3-hydroxydecanoyl-(acyl carrier protein) dehydratase
MSESGATRIRIEAQERYFAGHFPGDPVVPGVVILEHVIDTISRRSAAMPPTSGVTPRVRHIDGVKFLAPLRPGDELDIELEPVDADSVRFVCRCADRLIATGTIQASHFESQS